MTPQQIHLAFSREFLVYFITFLNTKKIHSTHVTTLKIGCVLPIIDQDNYWNLKGVADFLMINAVTMFARILGISSPNKLGP